MRRSASSALKHSVERHPLSATHAECTRGCGRQVDDEIRRRCDLQITEVPASLQAFVDRYENRDRKQLTLRLV